MNVPWIFSYMILLKSWDKFNAWPSCCSYKGTEVALIAVPGSFTLAYLICGLANIIPDLSDSPQSVID